jgi:hypothetical protein
MSLPQDLGLISMSSSSDFPFGFIFMLQLITFLFDNCFAFFADRVDGALAMLSMRIYLVEPFFSVFLVF